MVSSKKGTTDYDQLKVTELKALLIKRGETPKGNKKDLIKMLQKTDLKSKAPAKKASASKRSPPKKSSGKAPKKGKKSKKQSEEEEVEEEEVEEEAEEDEEEEAEEEEVEEDEEEEAEPEEEVEEEVEEEEVEDEGEEEDSEPEEDLEEEEEEDLEEEVAESEEEEPSSTSEPEEPEPEVELVVKKSSKKPALSFKKSSKVSEISVEEPEVKKEIKAKSFKVEASSKAKELEGEGFYGTFPVVSGKLCENRKALEVFSPKTEEAFQKLMEDVFRSRSDDQLKKIIRQFVSVEGCDLDPGFRKIYEGWLDDIADHFLKILRISPGVLEPRFDSKLGIYRIDNYAFQQDPEKSTSLVFAYIEDGKVVPLTAKTIKACPQEYSLYHVYHRGSSPPDKSLIKKIVESTPLPRLEPGVVEIEAEGEGISFPIQTPGTEVVVTSDLAKISIPEPNKNAFLAYRAAQRKYKSTNYKSIAEKAGITEDDALYIASHFKEMENKYIN